MVAKGRKAKRVKTRSARPEKPAIQFPLFVHGANEKTWRWCKKVRQRHVYFFRLADDPDGQKSLVKWLQWKDDLLAGRDVQGEQAEGDSSIARVCNEYLTLKKRLVEAGELSARTLEGYIAVAKTLVEIFGRDKPIASLRSDDFAAIRAKLSETCGIRLLSVRIIQVKAILNYAFESEIVATPIKTGPWFERPTKRAMKLHKSQSAPRYITANAIRSILGVSDPLMRALVLCGINCAFGNADVGRLKLRHLDLDSGWVRYPRGKTGESRRAKLWPETVAAIRDYLAIRPKPAKSEYDQLVFLTGAGNTLHTGRPDSPVSKKFRRLARLAKVYTEGVSFYALRHSFFTEADRLNDKPAIRMVMGHSDKSMDGEYRERMDDDRLERIANHVHHWLYGDEATAKPRLRVV